jgi:DNA-binding transcriptional LysR family regulator
MKNVKTNIDQLRAMKMVLAISDKGSLTAAAELLNTSLPTVVRQLAMLETYLGVTLFDRTTRKIHITDEGAMYLEAARQIVKDTLALEISLANRQNSMDGDALRANIHAPSGNMTITAPVLFGRMHVMPVVNAFMAEYAQVTAHVLLQDTLTDLVEAGIDVAFRIGEITLPDIVAVKIGEVQRVICASPAYLAGHDIQTPNDLMQAKCIKNLALNKGNHWKFNVKGKQTDINVPISFTSNNIDAVITHCLAGLGVGVFLSYQVKSLLQNGELLVVLTDYPQPSLPVSIIYPKTKRHLSRTSYFIDFAKDTLKVQLDDTFATK